MSRDVTGFTPDLDTLTEAAQRLCDSIADKTAVDGLVRSGHITDWRKQMDADDEYLAALKACRTALDGRPR